MFLVVAGALWPGAATQTTIEGNSRLRIWLSLKSVMSADTSSLHRSVGDVSKLEDFRGNTRQLKARASCLGIGSGCWLLVPLEFESAVAPQLISHLSEKRELHYQAENLLCIYSCN
jgi:hypothetical protein